MTSPCSTFASKGGATSITRKELPSPACSVRARAPHSGNTAKISSAVAMENSSIWRRLTFLGLSARPVRRPRAALDVHASPLFFVLPELRLGQKERPEALIGSCVDVQLRVVPRISHPVCMEGFHTYIEREAEATMAVRVMSPQPWIGLGLAQA